MSWSLKFTKKTPISVGMNAPPPYSCTRLRTLKGAGVSSSTPTAARQRRRLVRPFSRGLLSSQKSASPSDLSSDRDVAPAAIAAAEMGEGQDP